MACSQAGGTIVLEGTDHREGVGGWFSVVQCDGCGLARTEPVPVDPGAWYPVGYQQHDAPDTTTTKVVRKAIRRAAVTDRGVTRAVVGMLVPDAAYLGDISPGRRVLDVGAGNGTAVSAFLDAGAIAWGVEPSSAGVSVCRARGLNTVIEGTLESALDSGAIASEGWDLVRMYQVLEHVPDPVATLRRIHGILAPDGRLVIGVPNFDSLARKTMGSSWDGLELPRHLTHFTTSALRMVLQRAGFRVDRVGTVALFGILPGTVDARTAGGERQRGWSSSLPVRAAFYPVELGYAALGKGDGIMASASPAA